MAEDINYLIEIGADKSWFIQNDKENNEKLEGLWYITIDNRNNKYNDDLLE